MKKQNLWEKIKRHKRVTGGLLVIVFCLAVVTAIGGVFPANEVTESGNIPEHDGDVLVDSIKVDEETKDKKSKKEKDTDLVASDQVEDGENSDSYFQEMRATINMDRNQVISMLTDTEAQATSATEKDNANKQKLKLLQYMEQEQNVENIIKTKGLPECLVLITDTSVNITVNKQDLKQSDVAKISDIVIRETNRKAPELVIQSKF